jgi:hypothetical protein
MYSAENFKQDVLVNIKSNGKFDREIYSILINCQFQFNDSGEFTRIVWNTYKRNLIIFCAAEV